MKLSLFRIDFDSETVKLMSERVNVLSWATGGLKYLGFELHDIAKITISAVGWIALQYFSFVLLKISKTLKKGEWHGIN
jgi:hypothetical protein